VGRDRDVEASALAQGLDQALDEPHADPLVFAGDEERRLRGHGEAAAGVEGEECSDGFASLRVERHYTLVPVLHGRASQEERLPGLAVAGYIVDVESGQLADAQAGVQVEGQHGVVADAEGVAQVDGREQAAGFLLE